MIFKELLSKPYFKINVVKDVEAVEFCGAFKVNTPVNLS